MTEEILAALACPVCGGGFALSENKKSLVCEKRHCYDIAASGYVNFCGSHGGDSKELVRARREFLSLGYYRPIADSAVELLSIAVVPADAHTAAKVLVAVAVQGDKPRYLVDRRLIKRFLIVAGKHCADKTGNILDRVSVAL